MKEKKGFNIKLFKKSKTINSLIFLMTINLICVGFSSWFISQDVKQKSIDFKIGEILSLLKINSSKGNYNICKYGFVDSGDQILSSCVFSWNATFYQFNARQSGFINDNGDTKFEIILSDATTNSFLDLVENSFFSCAFYVTYNGVNTERSLFSLDNNLLKSELLLTGIDNNETNELIFNVELEFNEDNATKLESVLETYDYDAGLSFDVSIRFLEEIV